MNPITRTGAGALLLAGLGLSTAAQASTFTVTNLNDDDNCSVGYCTLRGAVNNANLNLGDDVVDATGIAGTITLNGTEIEVTDNVTIVGPGAQVLAVSGNDRSRIFNVAASGTLSLADLTLTGGRAPDGSYGASGQSGGAILSAGTLSINHCTLSANQAGNSGHNDLRDGRGGGGGAIASSGTLNITNSTLSANQAGNGGDGDYYGGGGGNGGAIASSGTLSMTNSTLSDNRTGAGGGGALGSGGGGNGGGIFTSSPMAPALANSLLANNGSNCWGTPTDDGGNLDDGSSCGFTALTSLSNAIANLGPLQDNGGPTQTYALLAGSAAIDAGIASACTGTDQRGVIRPQGPACDIGAFELEPASRYTLSVILAGTGSGLVTSNMGGINCASGSTNTCSADYDANTAVTLTAAARSDSEFTGWSGCASSSGTSCTVTLDQARSVTAAFAFVPDECTAYAPTRGCTVNGVANKLCMGTTGNDTIIAGGNGRNVIIGGDGNDTLTGGNGDDLICGGRGNDLIRGARGNDTLLGSAGNDNLGGDDGNDRLSGGLGTDSANGGKGTDTCTAESRAGCEQ